MQFIKKTIIIILCSLLASNSIKIMIKEKSLKSDTKYDYIRKCNNNS